MIWIDAITYGKPPGISPISPFNLSSGRSGSLSSEAAIWRTASRALSPADRAEKRPARRKSLPPPPPSLPAFPGI